MFGRRNWQHPKVGVRVLRELHSLAFQLSLGDGYFWEASGGIESGHQRAAKVEKLFGDVYYAVWGITLAKEKKQTQVQWRGFKDVKLTGEQRDAYESWDAQDADVYELLASAVVAGYKFTVSYNSGNDTYSATFTGQGEAPASARGYSLSAFAPSWYDACRTLAFKHFYVLDGDWEKIAVQQSDRWG
uniref:Uncharacterized protein n=1 Tax=uncultured prokaryote TaxID=198431 RepID=A0A0H5QKW3_9ZZZZ|nr:hypothetical protein [uncultured prokaryote]